MVTSLSLEANPVPLTADGHGWVRITGTRIPLETVIRAHRQGNTPEQIAESFPSLRLSDIYLVLGYALSHPEEIDSYLREVEQEEQRARALIERDPEHAARTARLRQKLRERAATLDP